MPAHRLTVLLNSVQHVIPPARNGWLALACCLLTLLATLDPGPLAQATLGSLAHPSAPSPAPEEGTSDDEMVVPTDSVHACRAVRKWLTPDDRCVAGVSRPPLRSGSAPAVAEASPAWEHGHRNGIGAPLLC